MADPATLTFAFMRSHPSDAARVLESATTSESKDLLARAPGRIGGAVLAEMLPRSAADVLLAMSEERALEILAHIEIQRAVAILRHFDAGKRTRFLSELPTTTAFTAKLLLEFVDDSVGSCMNPEVIALAGAVSVDVALNRVRNANATFDRIYVIDDSRHLVGWAPLTALMRAPAGARLESLALPTPAKLPAHTPLAGAQSHHGWHAASTLPVVDRHDRLLGEIARDALERAAHRMEPTRIEASSLTAVMVHGYWQSITGILELIMTLLPAGRPIGPSRDER